MNDSSVSASSLKNLGARLNMAIDAVIQAESDLNALRRGASMEPVKAFYLPSEHRIGVREAEARKPQEGWLSRQQQPRQRSPHDPMTCLRVIVAAMTHPELCSEDWPTIVELMADLAARGQDEPTDEQAKFIVEFNDGVARRMRAVGPKLRARKLREHRKWWVETQVDEDEQPVDKHEDDEPDEEDETEDDERDNGPDAPPVKVPPDSRDKDKPEAVHVATAAAEILRAGAVRSPLARLAEARPGGGL
jgi:hypothetical protein